MKASEYGLTGGHFRTGPIPQTEQNLLKGEAPKMFRIGTSTDTPLAFRVCKDATLCAVAWQSGELHVYRVSYQIFITLVC